MIEVTYIIAYANKESTCFSGNEGLGCSRVIVFVFLGGDQLNF